MINRRFLLGNGHGNQGGSFPRASTVPALDITGSVIRSLHEESVGGLEGGTGRVDIVLRRNDPSKALSDEVLVDGTSCSGRGKFTCQVISSPTNMFNMDIIPFSS